ncbi:hypothetical protein BDF22DRAFT_617567 [Syncephalis plumigaleata]|nr:hypothetical protein BDF22DRAFT_617567 [Syncephalis plumigaleata]
MNTPEANLTDVQDTQVSDSDLVERIRCWRHDAMQQHLYDSAIFWGDKVVSMTNDPNDIFWLAQVYYLTGQYVRVEKLLTRKHLLNSSVACRFLAAQCMTKLKKWQAALEILGETNPFTKMNGNGQVSQVKNAPEGIKLEASMCYLRGQVYLEQENVKRAKECFKEALKTDIKCYEAYQALVINQMMKQTEEQEFLSSLDFTQLREEDAKFVRSIYTIKQRMPSNNKELLPLKRTLEEEYGLVNNVDVELSIADSAFARGRFKDCLTITKGLLKVEQYHPTVLTTHIACLYELRDQHRLFHLGKELVDRFPELPVTWFCVGCYYFSVKKTTEARRYFKKSSQMDTNYGPARIGYAHTFAEEGEYDQAIQEYSSADRLFPGSHFPTLFIGMQLLKQKNLSVAQEYLLGAAELGPSDALLNNELAVLYYEQKEYEKSIEHFNMALDMIKEMEYDASVENDIWSNLGQAHRRLGNYEEAKKCFIKLKTRCPRRADAYTGLGYVHHAMGDIEKAIEYYHQALGLSSNNPLTTELLNMAIQEQVDGGLAKIASYDEVSFSLDDLPSDTLSVEGTEQRPLTASLNAFMSSHQQHTSNNGDNDDHVEGVDQQDDYHHIDSESSGTDMSFD